MTKHIGLKTHDMSDSDKIDLTMRALFGDFDNETLERTPGLLAAFGDLRRRVNYIMYGGAVSSFVVLLHFLGAPTQTIWQIVSKVPLAFLGH
jgi:hypothetical protein